MAQKVKKNKTKKVIILIVEGESDLTLLYERLDNLYRPIGIKFKVYYGDIFFDSADNTLIKNRVGNVVNKLMKKYYLHHEDILTVIHIMDTDGCFIPDSSIVLNKSQNKNTLYYDDTISVAKTQQTKYIINRNAIKKKNVNTMSSIHKIRNRKIDYRLFYFSRNLEHVLFNDPNAEKDKIERVQTFLNKLKTPLEEFLSNFMICIDVDDFDKLYSESWKLIKQDNNSLKRSTNSSLVFKYLSELQEVLNTKDI